MNFDERRKLTELGEKVDRALEILEALNVRVPCQRLVYSLSGMIEVYKDGVIVGHEPLSPPATPQKLTGD